MTQQPRDILGVFIPERISTMSDAEILAAIDQLQARREAVLAELSKAKNAQHRPRSSKEKVQDLTKLDRDDVYTAIAAQMGISVDEFKRLVAGA